MPLNRACLGKSYPPAVTEVTREAIHNYARACNDDNPRYFDPAVAGGIVAPPMFAVVATWIPLLSAITDPELHADLLRLLHTRQEMEFLAPIRPRDQIVTTATIATIVDAPGGESMTVELSAAANQTGAPVNRTRFTVLIRGRRVPEARGAPADESARGAAPLAVVTQTIDRDQTFRYAEASGDRNPIHVDENVAKLAGLPGIIVHGLCTMAFVARALIEQVCAGDPLRLKRLALNFSRPVFPGDAITTSIWAAADTRDPRCFTFATVNAEGMAVIRNGSAEVSP
jgi:acyl dehydratase